MENPFRESPSSRVASDAATETLDQAPTQQ